METIEKQREERIEKRKESAKKSIATMLALILIISGTFAWQSFNQEANNKTIGRVDNPGARLHDDFNGVNKDVYIENYAADTSLGKPVYARIRLDEFMAIGEGGNVGDEDALVLRGDLAKGNGVEPIFEDATTWDTYLFGSQAVDGVESIRTYRDLEFGGSTIYLPTFNKNADSLTPDINGTLGGLDGDKLTEADAYLDYYVYTNGESRSGTAYYDMDDNTIDEGEYSELGTNHYTQEEVHYATSTLDSQVISMSTWLSMSEEDKIGNYWVYDVDGWAYWAAPIECATATGLLLTGITTVTNPKQDWYYAISVTSQIATQGDWGLSSEEAEDGLSTGMYAGGMTENGLYLLELVSGGDDLDSDDAMEGGDN